MLEPNSRTIQRICRPNRSVAAVVQTLNVYTASVRRLRNLDCFFERRYNWAIVFAQPKLSSTYASALPQLFVPQSQTTTIALQACDNNNFDHKMSWPHCRVSAQPRETHLMSVCPQWRILLDNIGWAQSTGNLSTGALYTVSGTHINRRCSLCTLKVLTSPLLKLWANGVGKCQVGHGCAWILRWWMPKSTAVHGSLHVTTGTAAFKYLLYTVSVLSAATRRSRPLYTYLFRGSSTSGIVLKVNRPKNRPNRGNWCVLRKVRS